MSKPPIAEVLRDHGATRIPTRTGWAAMPCPYHDDSNASASVNHDLGRYRCHGCGVAGDAYDLIQHHDGVDYLTAVRYGETRFGVSRDTTRPARTTGSRPARRYQPRWTA